MKHRIKFFFIIVGFLIINLSYGQLPPPATQATPYYSIRPQGVDAARQLSGWTRAINQYDSNCFYGSVSITAEYARSFNGIDIAKSLMTPNCISGSQVTTRNALCLMAENFYLPTDYTSCLTSAPLIQNTVVDIEYYMGFNKWLNGLFFRINAPINFSRWSLSLIEDDQSTNVDVSSYDPGYFNNDGIPNAQLFTSFSQYLSGNVPFAVSGVVFDPLCYAKVEGCSGDRSVTCLADLSWVFGWNFINREQGHLGLGILTRAPTGNRPNAEFLFEPISGNGGHWEFGAHITSHYTFWQCKEENSSLGLYVDANITHLFNTRQTRTFDLIGKPLSRYMLAQRLGSPVNNLIAVGSDATTHIPIAQFQHEFCPVANLTTRTLKVNAAVQADIVAQFSYKAGDGFTLDFGYNFWARSCDKFCFDTCTSNTLCNTSVPCSVAFTPDTWALKGDAYVIGFDLNTNSITPVALSATQNQATIYAGTNLPATGPGVDPNGNLILTPLKSNSGIDNRQLAFTSNGDPLFGTISGDAGTQIGTSLEPIFIKESDINFAATRGMSHKVYAHMSYTCMECACATPYIGIGGFGEFGVNANACNKKGDESSCAQSCSNSCSMVSTSSSSCNTGSCNTASLSQWGVWIKMGASF